MLGMIALGVLTVIFTITAYNLGEQHGAMEELEWIENYLKEVE